MSENSKLEIIRSAISHLLSQAVAIAFFYWIVVALHYAIATLSPYLGPTTALARGLHFIDLMAGVGITFLVILSLALATWKVLRAFRSSSAPKSEQ